MGIFATLLGTKRPEPLPTIVIQPPAEEPTPDYSELHNLECKRIWEELENTKPAPYESPAIDPFLIVDGKSFRLTDVVTCEEHFYIEWYRPVQYFGFRYPKYLTEEIAKHYARQFITPVSYLTFGLINGDTVHLNVPWEQRADALLFFRNVIFGRRAGE